MTMTIEDDNDDDDYHGDDDCDNDHLCDQYTFIFYLKKIDDLGRLRAPSMSLTLLGRSAPRLDFHGMLDPSIFSIIFEVRR